MGRWSRGTRSWSMGRSSNVDALEAEVIVLMIPTSYGGTGSDGFQVADDQQFSGELPLILSAMGGSETSACVLKVRMCGTVLSEIGFLSRAVATKFAPHGR